MPYRNPAVSAVIQGKYSDQFRALFQVMDLASDFVAAAKTASLNSAAKYVIFLYFTRGMNNLSAATVLLEEGYPIEATALTRGLIEDFINICYIAHHDSLSAEELAERFIEYQEVAHFEQYQKAKAARKSYPEDRYQETLQAKLAFVKKYRNPDLDDWSGLRLWKKATQAQVELKAPGEARDAQLKEIYDTLNGYFSETVHGGPFAWKQQVLEGEGTITYRSGPQDIETAYQLVMGPMALLACQLVQVAAEACDLTEVQKKAIETRQAIGQLVTGSTD